MYFRIDIIQYSIIKRLDQRWENGGREGKGGELREEERRGVEGREEKGRGEKRRREEREREERRGEGRYFGTLAEGSHQKEAGEDH